MGPALYIIHLLLPKTIQHFYDNTRSYGKKYYFLSFDHVLDPIRARSVTAPLRPTVTPGQRLLMDEETGQTGGKTLPSHHTGVGVQWIKS